MDIVQYVRARSLDEAWELNQKKTAVVLGGCCWLRLSARRPIPTAIDLLGMGLDKIEETEQEYRLGAMVSLHEMELSAELDTYTCGALREAVRHIVGVQFRRMATLGGSICGRFGFSDVLTLFLVLDAEVELYHGGRQKLADFARTGAGRDILTHVLLPKRRLRAAYTSLRLSAADFPVLACAAAQGEDGVRCAIGARPRRAELVPGGAELLADGCTSQALEAYAQHAASTLDFGTNLRGSAEYRRAMAAVLVRRVLQQSAEEAGK